MKKEQPIGAALKHQRYYKDICLAALPLLVMAWFYYGWRPVLMCAAAVVLGNLIDRIVARLRHRIYIDNDWSNECLSLMIALLLPASCSWYVLVVAVLAGIFIGKELFGGYGCYPFHPAAVGYVIAAVSWPEQVFRFPVPGTKLPLGSCANVQLVSSISTTLKNGGLPHGSALDILTGNYAGPVGTTAVLVIFACGILLWVRGDIDLIAPAAFFVSCALLVFLFPRQGVLEGTPLLQTLGTRCAIVAYELLSDAMLFGAVFLFSEPTLLPRTAGGRVVYGLLLGIMTVGFRYYGAFQSGVCFAILAANGVSDWLDIGMLRLEELIASRKKPAKAEKEAVTDAG